MIRRACLFAALAAQASVALAAPAERTALVDPEGVLRWQDDGSEVALFGVNYYVPFFWDYALLRSRGLDHKQAIREDVAHFQRLGLTAIRLHCFDRQISDAEGNLLDNHHLELLDYLIALCRQRGIYSVMTPIAWWPTDPGPVAGFSNRFTMQQMTTDLEARRAQCRYLAQFMEHVNRFTGLPYKDDPAIVAIELINEPMYPPGTTDEQITDYIDTLVSAVRSTGCTKPIFYNAWGGRHRAAAPSSLDGVSFGWYPTGLVSGSMLTGSYLGAVNDYPSMRDPVLARKAKMVYEFDAADVHGSVMYPAMARAFRRGGAQIATQFQYDPMCIAGANPTWQTHYLNLIYTPAKAISFAIAAEAFRRLPRLADFGPYPQSCRFGDFRVSFEEDLSELAAPDVFMHSNNTTTAPPDPAASERIAGCGSSPLVRYEGAGAYFLDRLGPGAWRLQIYPDAVMVADPYTGGNNEKIRCLWGHWSMEIRLPDLGTDFAVLARMADGSLAPIASASEGAWVTTPGEFVLLRPGMEPPADLPQPEFIAPPSSTAPPAAHADNPKTWRHRRAYRVRASVAMSGDVSCLLHFRPVGAAAFETVPMVRTRAYEYEATVPADLIQPGVAQYYLSVHRGDEVYTFPGGLRGQRTAEELMEVPPIPLLKVDAETVAPPMEYFGPEGLSSRSSVVRGPKEGTYGLRFEADGFGPGSSCTSAQWKVEVPPEVAGYTVLAVVARGGPDTSAVEISLVQRDGNAFGVNVPLSTEWYEFTLPVHNLRPMWDTKALAPDLSQLDHVTLVFGTWLFPDVMDHTHWVELAALELRRVPPRWEVTVPSDDAPVVLADFSARPVQVQAHPASLRRVPGPGLGERALRVSVQEFGPPPDATAVRLTVPEGLHLWRDEMAQATAVEITARAGYPHTNLLELVLIEDDGSPWGTMDVELTSEWQRIRIPLDKFRYFSHWNPPTGDRGGPEDRLRPEHVQTVSICFGSWLYPQGPKGPHAIEIAKVSLVR